MVNEEEVESKVKEINSFRGSYEVHRKEARQDFIVASICFVLFAALIGGIVASADLAYQGTINVLLLMGGLGIALPGALFWRGARARERAMNAKSRLDAILRSENYRAFLRQAQGDGEFVSVNRHASMDAVLCWKCGNRVLPRRRISVGSVLFLFLLGGIPGLLALPYLRKRCPTCRAKI